ncbi:hypothetical protein P3T73_02840 [Kiritimatiellota bacterium B12222]|nr:hypothetical protein P3T73_02840 [Kiritimatiellota bacterium B12222]
MSSTAKLFSFYLRVSALLLWWILLSTAQSTHPLSGPPRINSLFHSWLPVSDAVADMLASLVMKGLGLSLLGVLLVYVCKQWRSTRSFPLLVAGTVVLVISSQWIHYGNFPIPQQVFLGVCSAIVGVLLGFVLLRNRWALWALLLFLAVLYFWGTSTGISNQLNELTQQRITYLLDQADEIPDGDAGWAMLMTEAFQYTEEDPEAQELIRHHQAAILALSVILGEEKVAKVARRDTNPAYVSQSKALRKRITLYGRHDLSQHYWVSAGLAVLSSEKKSITVGISKEMMDADGGSGFSFVDLTVDRAGTLLTASATHSPSAAQTFQQLIQQGVQIADFCPNPLDLPEGIQQAQFKSEYGGLGGKKTSALANEINNRLAACSGLQYKYNK